MMRDNDGSHHSGRAALLCHEGVKSGGKPAAGGTSVAAASGLGGRRSRRSNRAPPCGHADRDNSGGAPSLAAAIQASAASRAEKRLLPPAAALDSITPSHSTGCSDEPSLPSSLVAETTRNPQIPQPAKPRRKPRAEIDLTPPPEPHRRRSPTPRNSRAKTRRGAHLGRIWTKSRARGRLSDARAALPPAPPPQRRKHASTPAEAWGPAARWCCSGGWFRRRGWIGEDGSGGDGAASAGGRFAFLLRCSRGLAGEGYK